MSSNAIFAFFMVFLRAGALLMSSPIFGAQNTPMPVRVLTTACLSAALSCAVGHAIGPAPDNLYTLAAMCTHEILSGLLIGTFMTLALQVALIAGSLMDLQIGLGSSQIMNPVNGVSVSVMAQYKYMLGIVIFLCSDAHHLVIQAFVRSYDAVPGLSMSTLPTLETNYIHLISGVFLIAVQIATPVMAVGLLLDGTFGLINRAVPHIQVMQVGLPAKLAIGMITVSLALPALTVGITSAVEQSVRALAPMFRG